MSGSDLRLLMLAHNHATTTAVAVETALGQMPANARLLLLDNASGPHDAPVLRALAERHAGRVRLERSETNLGFAGGMNRLIARGLDERAVGWFLLLNNDVMLGPGALNALMGSAAAGHGRTMVALRMMRFEDEDAVDSLGIALYRSGLASNRKTASERMLGPTGGCMFLGRALLEDIQAQHGYWFDERFFCYAEDTDFVMRARWLGYEGVLADGAEALHHGSLSSGGPDNEFVLYHGIRNSIWALAKNAPGSWLIVHLPWIALAHAGIWLRNLRKGRARTLLRLYRDAVVGLPAMVRERARVRRSRRVPASAWWRAVEPRLYERGYLRAAWRDLWRRAGR